MTHPSPRFPLKIAALSLVFLLCMATAAIAAQKEIVVVELDVPAYASLEEAKKGGKTEATVEGFFHMIAGEQYAHIVLEEKDGWIKVANPNTPEAAPAWIRASVAIPLEAFLAAPQYKMYTTCSQELPYSFAVDLDPDHKGGQVKLTPRPTLHGGVADIDIYDAAGVKLWSSNDPANLALGEGRLYAECRGSAASSKGVWIRAAGDLDGDGRMEMFTGGDPEFDVSPAEFNLFRWNGEKPVFIRKFMLSEPLDATIWRITYGESRQNIVFAMGDIQPGPDNSIDFTIHSWKNADSGVARMRMDKSGEHFTLEKWVRPYGANP